MSSTPPRPSPPPPRPNRHTVLQATKNVMKMVHVRYYSEVYGYKRARCLELATVIIKINKIVKPTRNWEHTPSLFEASQNLSASRNIVFTYFQVCVTEMASSQNGKMYQVSCSCEAGNAPFVGSELLSCLKLLKNRCGKRHSRIGSVVQTNKRFS